MAITLNTLVYNQDTFVSNNKVLYTGPSNTFSVKDQLSLARTAAKPTSTFAGVARSEIKRTKTVTLADSTTAEAIVTLSFALPVGMVEADADSLVNDVCDLGLATEGNALYWDHDINQ